MSVIVTLAVLHGNMSLALLGRQFLRTPESATPCRFNSEIDTLCTMVATALSADGRAFGLMASAQSRRQRPGASARTVWAGDLKHCS